MLIIDGDYPMAIGAMDLNRDLTLPLPELRGAAPDRFAEESRPDADTMASLPEMRRAGIAAALVKVVARHYRSGSPMWGYRGPEVTYAAARAQLALLRDAGGARAGQDPEGRLRTLQPPAIVVDRGVTGRTAGGIHPRHGGGRPHSGNHPGAPVVAGRNTSHQPFPLRHQHLLSRHRHRHLGGACSRPPRPCCGKWNRPE